MLTLRCYTPHNMGKTIFFNIPAAGHVNPTLPLVAELVQCGEQVVYVNYENYRQQIESLGARLEVYPELAEANQLLAHLDDSELPWHALMLVKIAEKFLPLCLDLIEREQPDYLITDSLAGWGVMVGKLLGLPTIVSTATLALDPQIMGRAFPRLMLRSAIGFLRVWPQYRPIARRIQKAWDVPCIKLTEALGNTGDLTLVYTSQQFQPNGDNFDDSYRFVGPSLGLRGGDGAFPFEQVQHKPLVYISLGTINNRKQDFYQQCFRAFGDYPGQFVLSVGQATEIESLGAIPANFIVRNFVPQLEILQRADLFITHGGVNSIHEGLYHHVPLVVLPQQMEQAINARRVADLGAGIALGAAAPPFGQVDTTTLRAATEQVLSQPAFKQHAAQLGDSLRAAGGSARAAEEILAFVARWKVTA